MSNRERNAWVAVLLVLCFCGLLYGIFVPAIGNKAGESHKAPLVPDGPRP